MRVDDLRKAHQARPFQPFSIRVADGMEYTVNHPEFMSFSLSGRTVVVATPDDWYAIIDTMMITSVHVGNGKKPTRRKRKR